MSFSQLKRSNSNSDVNLLPKAKKHHIDENNTWLNNILVFSSVELTNIENIHDSILDPADFFNFIQYDVSDISDDMDILIADADADSVFLSDALLTKDDEDTDEVSDALLAEDDEDTDEVLDALLAEDDEDTNEDFFIYFLFDIQSYDRMEVDLDSDEACAIVVLTNLK